MHDGVAARFKSGQNIRQRLGRRGLDVVKQHDAAFGTRNFLQRMIDEFLLVGDVAIVGDDVDGECGDPARLQIAQERCRIRQSREAEERRDRLAGGRGHGR